MTSGAIFSLTNSDPIDDVLTAFIAKLEELRGMIRQPELGKEFDRAAAAAHALRGVETL